MMEEAVPRGKRGIALEPANGHRASGSAGKDLPGSPDDAVAGAFRRCLAGDPEAFTAIVEAYERPVFNVAFRMTGDREDARDLAQVVLVKAFENLEKYDSCHRFFSWIYRIAVNESINFVSRRWHPVPLESGREAVAPSPEEEYAGSELSHHVQSALMELSPEQRAVIILRHFRGHAYRVMSDILSIPERTVKSRLFSARRALRESLVARGVL